VQADRRENQEAPKRLQLSLGWRFLYCPDSLLTAAPEILFLGFNAAGDRFAALFPASFCELGVARFEEEFSRLPFQRQGAVLKSLRERADECGLEDVLPSHLRPML
jgi:hypothetical protein